jgi:uncharacterized OsmC-like protein
MPEYNVRVDLNSMNFDIEADNEDEAIQKASELAMEKTIYDILKWADYEVEIEE